MISDATEPNGEPRDPTAPKLENLKLAFGMLQGELTKSKAAAALNGKRKKVDPHAKPTNFCPVCLKTFASTNLIVNDALTPKPCMDCRLKLEQGMVALVCVDKRIAWVFGLVPSEADLHASGGVAVIDDVSVAVMDKVMERFQQQAKVKDETGEQGAG